MAERRRCLPWPREGHGVSTGEEKSTDLRNLKFKGKAQGCSFVRQRATSSSVSFCFVWNLENIVSLLF